MKRGWRRRQDNRSEFFPSEQKNDTHRNTSTPDDTVETIDFFDSDTTLDELLPISTTAISIRHSLDEVVVGQRNAKDAISVLLSAHLSGARGHGKRESPNALLIGPTGVGKTHSVQTAVEYLGLPFVNVDSTALVPSDIHEGMTIEKVLIELIISAETILAEANMFAEISGAELAARGLIFLDEFDKLRAGKESDWNLRVQRRLLRLIEGSFPAIREMRGEVLDTSQIVFLASGTFEGIRDPSITSRRPAQLTSALRDPDRVVSADLVTYGFLPELIARLPVLVPFESLSVDDLVGILQTPAVDPTNVWRQHFAKMGKELIVEDGAKLLLAENAEKLNMGARGLQQVMFPMLARMSFGLDDSPGRTLVISREMCEKQLRMGW